MDLQSGIGTGQLRWALLVRELLRLWTLRGILSIDTDHRPLKVRSSPYLQPYT